MLKETNDGIIATIRISPNAKKNEIIRDGEFTKIKITKTNSEIIFCFTYSFLAVKINFYYHVYHLLLYSVYNSIHSLSTILTASAYVSDRPSKNQCQ